MTPTLLTSHLRPQAPARRPAAAASITTRQTPQLEQTSANAPVFTAASDIDRSDVIEAWARQASYASGFGGGLAEVDIAPAAPAAARQQPSYALRRILHIVAERIRAWLVEQRAVMRARATARDLAELDERQLRDIGISRSEILSVALESERAVNRSTARMQTQRAA